jgi:isoquinoline 1-oxidoreductase beta subunit
MEPLNATVRVDGDRVETWSGNQSPTRMKILAALAAGTTPEKVTVHTTFLGGGFGRKTDGDELFQTTLLAKAVAGRPVKMIWSREDDIMNDKFRPLTAQHVEVGLDASGDIAGWRHRIVNESYLARIMPPDLFAKVKQDRVSGGGGEMSYAVPNHRVEWVRAARGVDVGAWRGIAAGYTKFAIETLIDEIAALKGMDPVAYRIALLKEIRAPQPSSRRSPTWQSGAGSDKAAHSGSPIPIHSAATPRPWQRCRSKRRAGRSRSITCGPRSTPVSPCSPRTSWRRLRVP